MKILQDEYPWTESSGDPISLSCCDHREPTLCHQSGRNTMETPIMFNLLGWTVTLECCFALVWSVSSEF